MRAPNESVQSGHSASKPAAERDLSISTLLVLLGIGTVVPVLLFSALLIYNFGTSERSLYELRANMAAREAQAAVDRELKGSLGALQTLATSPLLTLERLPEFYEQAKQVAQYLKSGVSVFDPASLKQILNTDVPYGAELPYQPNSKAGTVARTGKPTISDLLTDQFGKHFSFAIYVPAIREGSVTAVIAGSFQSAVMARILQEDVQSPYWAASIIGTSGTILARSKDSLSFTGMRAPSGMLRHATSGSAVARTHNPDGEFALVGFAPSTVADWVIATSVPLDIIEAPLRQSWSLFGMAGTAFLAVSAAFALALGRYLTRPVSRILQAVASLGRGETVSPARSGLRELDVISRALSQASTERKSAQEHIDLLMREQAHRNKNLLTVVQAIARLTARHAEDFQAFERTFSDRMAGLASSNDLLVSQRWLGADPASLVQAQLVPFTELDGSRVKMDGPPLTLKPEAAEALGLALHELATNALKYGALSVPEGFVSIQWRQEARRFFMSWDEYGGPAVTAPSAKGFGSVVIEQMTAHSLSANVSFDFPGRGVHWTIDMPANVAVSPMPGGAAELSSASPSGKAG